MRLNQQPLPFVTSEYKITDPSIDEILKMGTKRTKKNKKKKKKASAKEGEKKEGQQQQTPAKTETMDTTK